MGVHKVSAFHPFIFQKSGKSTIIRNLAVARHFVAYHVFISSIRVDTGPRNRGPTSLLALKIRTTVANTGKLRSIGQVPVLFSCKQHFATLYVSLDPVIHRELQNVIYMKKNIDVQEKGGRVLSTSTCGLFVFSLLVIRFYYIKLKIY